VRTHDNDTFVLGSGQQGKRTKASTSNDETVGGRGNASARIEHWKKKASKIGKDRIGGYNREAFHPSVKIGKGGKKKKSGRGTSFERTIEGDRNPEKKDTPKRLSYETGRYSTTTPESPTLDA